MHPLKKRSFGDTSENDLLNALRNRDDQALKYVYQQNWPMILNMVKLNNGNASEAKDLYQESIMDFLQKVWDEKFILTCKIRTYIYSICRRKWLYQLRGRPQFTDIEEYAELEESTPGPSEPTAELPDDSQIASAINALGEPCRSLLIGFYYEGRSMEELAARMNYRSMEVAKQQKFRCKNRLKNALALFV